MSKPKQMVSIGEAAKMLGVHEATLRKWETDGHLLPIRTRGGHRRFRIEDINEVAERYLRPSELSVWAITPNQGQSVSVVADTMRNALDEFDEAMEKRNIGLRGMIQVIKCEYCGPLW